MANNNKFNGAKTNAKMDELTAIEKSPELTEYIIRTKIKDVNKTALILGIIAAVMAFVIGTLPLLILTLSCLKYYLQGMLPGAVKG